MGGLAGISLFVGVLLSGMFFRRGNDPLGFFFAVVAAAPVAFLFVDAVRNRHRAAGRRRMCDAGARRAARIAGGAGVFVGVGAAVGTLWWAVRVFAAPSLGASAVAVAVSGVLSLVLIVSAVRVLLLTWQGAAAVVRIMYLLGVVVGLTTAYALADLGHRWPIALGGTALTAVAVGVIVLQKRALRALGAPARSRPGKIY